MGRLTKTMTTTRPPNVWSEMWPGMSPKRKNEAIQAWAIEGPLRETARSRRGVITELSEEDEKDLQVQIAAAQLKYSGPPIPAMLVHDTGSANIAAANELLMDPDARPQGRAHDDHISESILPDDVSFFCVHKPISMKEVHKIPEAKQALAEEWKSLHDKLAWDLSKVKAKADVIAEAKATRERRSILAALWSFATSRTPKWPKNSKNTKAASFSGGTA